MDRFQLVSEYKPSGDQPEAITSLVNGVNWGLREQTLLGVTGSGKTFTMASVIEKLNRPTLVLAHNKTLAAQLCAEFREFFPNNGKISFLPDVKCCHLIRKSFHIFMLIPVICLLWKR